MEHVYRSAMRLVIESHGPLGHGRSLIGWSKTLKFDLEQAKYRWLKSAGDGPALASLERLAIHATRCIRDHGLAPFRDKNMIRFFPRAADIESAISREMEHSMRYHGHKLRPVAEYLLIIEGELSEFSEAAAAGDPLSALRELVQVLSMTCLCLSTTDSQEKLELKNDSVMCNHHPRPEWVSLS